MAERNIGLQYSGMFIKSNDGRWIPYSGTPQTLVDQVESADDLVLRIQYNEPSSRGTISGITYTSNLLGINFTTVWVSGTNTLTLTRVAG